MISWNCSDIGYNANNRTNNWCPIDLDETIYYLLAHKNIWLIERVCFAFDQWVKENEDIMPYFFTAAYANIFLYRFNLNCSINLLSLYFYSYFLPTSIGLIVRNFIEILQHLYYKCLLSIVTRCSSVRRITVTYQCRYLLYHTAQLVIS